MAESNKALKSNIARANQQMVPAAFESNIKGWYAANRKKILALVGGQEDRAALFVAAAFAQVNRIPKLLECQPETIYQCIVYSMGTGLLPGPMQQCVFIPFGREAVFVPMYQGLVQLAYNSGFVTRITSHVVWSMDEFDYDPATEVIYHRPFLGPEKDRGEREWCYCNIKNKFGEVQPMVKSAEFVNSIKARSKASKSSDSPWNSRHASDVDNMWFKTVFKQAAKWIPKATTPSTVQLSQAIELDNQADIGESFAASLLDDDIAAVKENVMLDDKQLALGEK